MYIGNLKAYILKASIATPTIPQKIELSANLSKNATEWPKNGPKWPKYNPNFFRIFFWTEKAVPQTLLLLECMSERAQNPTNIQTSQVPRPTLCQGTWLHTNILWNWNERSLNHSAPVIFPSAFQITRLLHYVTGFFLFFVFCCTKADIFILANSQYEYIWRAKIIF